MNAVSPPPQTVAPLFLANWERALFIHYETDPDILQRQVPFDLDLWHGTALVSVVAFSMRQFRPAFVGGLLRPLFKPANHEFLNVRTYVRVRDKPGIFFLAEWVNSNLSLVLGPPLYGLPYRRGKISYSHQHELRQVSGTVNRSFSYEGALPPATVFQACVPGSIDEFLLERYSAFTSSAGRGDFLTSGTGPGRSVRLT